MTRLSNICLIALVVFSVGCSNKTKPSVTGSKPVRIAPRSNAINQLYDFVETTDKNLCDPNSIVATDCGGGNFYFTKKKNVFCIFYCIGSDSVSYLVGKYSLTAQGIYCSFNREYSFNEKPKNGTPADPNTGKMKKRKPLEFKLSKINCENFDFSFNSISDGKYVLRKSDGKQSGYFFSTFKKIKTFSGL